MWLVTCLSGNSSAACPAQLGHQWGLEVLLGRASTGLGGGCDRGECRRLLYDDVRKKLTCAVEINTLSIKYYPQWTHSSECPWSDEILPFFLLFHPWSRRKPTQVFKYACKLHLFCLPLNEGKARPLHDKAAFLFITGNKRGLWAHHPQPRSPPLLMMTLKSIQPSSCRTFSVCCLSPFFPLLLWLPSAPSCAAPRPTSDIFIT